jgi:hypothetical protein
VSLLSINRLKVLVTEHAVYAECVKGLFKPQISHEKSPIKDLSSESVIFAISLACKPFANMRMLSCELYFADSHVHYLVLPTVEMQLSYNEKMDYARSMVINYWGDVAKSWPLRIQDNVHHQSTLVSCIPCLENIDIQAVFASMRPLLVHTQPYSARLLAGLTDMPSSAYVMVLEPNLMRLFLLNNNVCEYVSSQALHTQSLPEIESWLQRIQALQPAPTKAFYLVTDNITKTSMAKVVSFKNSLNKRLSTHGHQLMHLQSEQSLISGMQGGFNV